MSTHCPWDPSIVFFHPKKKIKIKKEIYLILQALNCNIDLPFFSMLKELNNKEMANVLIRA